MCEEEESKLADGLLTGSSKIGVIGVHEQTVLAKRLCEHENLGDTVSVKGRLARNVEFWKEAIEAPAYILDTIQHGYLMPLHEEPTEFFARTRHQL